MLNIKKLSKRPPMPELTPLTDFKQPKKHIATVAEFYADDFDERVNALIDDGYTLIERGVIVPHNNQEKTFFYADLEKVVYD